MKKFMLLSYGFEKPTPETMSEWGAWFASFADQILDSGHFPGGIEITDAGTTALPLASDSITGFCIFTADDMDAAEAIGTRCPHIASTRIYELMGAS